MNKIILVTISLLGATGVILGAMGAHALKEKLGLEGLKTFETGVKYHMIHVLVLLIIQLFPQFSPSDKTWISILFIVGILFFSGSLYTISLGMVSAKNIWFITPLGGLFFIAAWLLMAWKFWVK